VSSIVDFMLGHSPTETFQAEVMDELVVEFQRQEEWHSHLERPNARVSDLILGMPSGRARLVDQLEEATRQLEAKYVARREADAELETIRSSMARVWDLVLERANGLSSLATSLSSMVELLEDCIAVAIANGVRLGTRSALAAALSHFLELGTKLELPESGRNVDLTEDQVDALWTHVRPTSDLLTSFIPPSVACSSPNGAGVE
jgi:hypothetical protein